MVGRADELAEFVDAWGQASGGDGARTVVITGAAGIGKSLLAATALEAFAPRPVTVLSGRARVHTPAPYDWLAAVLTRRQGPALPVPADALAWLAQHPDAPRERYAPGALLRLAVRAVQAPVGTGPAARTLARLSGGPGAIRQHLGPLDVHEVGEVLGQVYPAPVPGRRRVDRAGDRGARLPGRRDVQQAGGQTAGHFHPDGYRARVEPAPQDQVGVAYRGGAVGGTAPPAARQLTTVGPCRPPPKPWSDTSSPPASPAR